MKSLNEYQNNQLGVFDIFETLKINFDMINEDNYFINHGAALDSFLHKAEVYADCITHNRVNENYNIGLNISEQQAIKDTLCMMFEHMKIQILIEEGVIEEGLIDIIKQGYNDTKEKITTGINNIKNKSIEVKNNILTKFSVINDFIKKIINGAFNTIKDVFNSLLGIIKNLDCTVKGLMEKCGYNTENTQKMWEAVCKNIYEITKKENINKVINNANIYNENIDESEMGLYEAFGKALQEGYIFKEDETIDQTSGDAVIKGDEDNVGTQGEKHNWVEKIFINRANSKLANSWLFKRMLNLPNGNQPKTKKDVVLSFVLQILGWLTVCVIIPGTIVAIMGPVGGVPVLVYIGCRAAWAGFKIWKVVVKIGQILKEQHTYSKTKRIIAWISVVLSLIGIGWTLFGIGNMCIQACSLAFQGLEIAGIIPDSVMLNFIPSLAKKLGEEAQNHPDFLTLWEHVKKIIGSIINKTAENSDEVTDAAGKAVKGIGGKFTDDELEAAKKYLSDLFTDNKVGASHFTDFAVDNSKDILENLPKGWTYYIDNIMHGGGVENVLNSPEGQEILKKYGDVMQKILVHASNSHGDTYSYVWAFNDSVRGKECADEILALMRKKAGNGIMQLIGSNPLDVVDDGGKTADFIHDFVIGSLPAPTISFKPDGGFMVRLGNMKQKENYVYYVDKNGVKKQTFGNIKHNNKIAFSKYEEIVGKIRTTMQEELQKVEKDEKNSKNIETINKIIDIIKNINNNEVIVYYGKRIKDFKESYIDNDDLLNEEFSEENKKLHDELEPVRKKIDEIYTKRILKNDDLKKLCEYDEKYRFVNDGIKNTKKFIKNFGIFLKIVYLNNIDEETSELIFESNSKYDEYKSEVRNKVKTLRKDDRKYAAFIKFKEIVHTDKIASLLKYIFEETNTDKTLFSNNAHYNQFVKGNVNIDTFISEDLSEIIATSFGFKKDKINTIIQKLSELYKILGKNNDSNSDKYIAEKYNDVYQWCIENIDLSSVIITIIFKLCFPRCSSRSISKHNDNNKNEGTGWDDHSENGGEHKGENEGGNPVENTDYTPSNSEELVPVLVWFPIFMYGMDIANATDQGPRPILYSMKNMYNSLEYFEDKEFRTMSFSGIESFLVNHIVAYSMVKTYNIIINKPATTDDKKNFKVVSPTDANRLEFGTFTNKQITDALNDNSVLKNYLSGKFGKLSITSSKKEQEQIETDTQNAMKKYDNNSNEIENIIIHDDELKNRYNLKDDKLKYKLCKDISNYHFAKRHKKREGLWNRIKSIFGFGANSKDNVQDDGMDKLEKILFNESLISTNTIAQKFNQRIINEKTNDLTKYVKNN